MPYLAWECVSCTWTNTNESARACLMCAAPRRGAVMWEIPPHKMTNIIKFRSGKTPSGLLAAALPKIAADQSEIAAVASSVKKRAANSPPPADPAPKKRAATSPPPAVPAPQDASRRPVVAKAAAAPPVRLVNGPTVPAIRPMAMSLEILGINKNDRGRRCEEHKCCGREVLAEDVVVRLRREQIMVPNRLSPGFHEEAAYTVNWVTEGVDRCRVGFLGREKVEQGGLFDGVLCQVTSITRTAHDDDVNKRAKVRHVCGYACAQVISPLNEG